MANIYPLVLLVILNLAGCSFHQTMKTSEASMQFPSSSEWQLVASDLEFPEGPVWTGERLLVSNCYGQRITEMMLAETVSRTWVAADSSSPWSHTNGLAIGPDEKLYACEFQHGRIIRYDAAGVSEVVSKGYQKKPFIRPNDLAFDRWGNLYFTDSGHYRTENPDGRVYRLAAGSQQVSVAAENLAFPNGLAFSSDHQVIYVAQSARQCITRFEIAPDGNLLNPTHFAELPGGDPDGMAFDAEGNLWVAHFGAGQVVIFSPDGSVLGKIVTPGKKPSNVAFGGTALHTLFLTEDETNCVYQIPVPVRGQGLPFTKF